MKPGTDTRKAELGKIHIAKQRLGMDDETYRDMLFTLTRQRSAADLDHIGRKVVLDHLKRIGGFEDKRGQKKRSYPGRPHNIETEDRGPLLKKIEAYLADNKLPWTYAETMARNICKVAKLEFCDASQLRKIVAALEYNARRQKKPK